MLDLLVPALVCTGLRVLSKGEQKARNLNEDCCSVGEAPWAVGCMTAVAEMTIAACRTYREACGAREAMNERSFFHCAGITSRWVLITFA